MASTSKISVIPNSSMEKVGTLSWILKYFKLYHKMSNNSWLKKKIQKKLNNLLIIIFEFIKNVCQKNK